LNVDDRVSLERPTYESSVVAKDLIDGGDLVAWAQENPILTPWKGQSGCCQF
jgi:hypothetical protein